MIWNKDGMGNIQDLALVQIEDSTYNRQGRKVFREKHQNLFRRYLLYLDLYTDRLILYIVFPMLLKRRRKDKIKEIKTKGKRRYIYGEICTIGI